ncbi:VCBS repeat-containing protein [Streptomyces sp. NPDC005917]|uniref:FG-GAP repeat domain-containing protein n=1 Tax=unclassified Streptomyces TaxID=2593676 RepID=UPI003411B0A2
MRHAPARLRLIAATAVLAATLSPLLPAQAATADTAQETVVPATYRSTYATASLFMTNSTVGGDGVGPQGVFHTLEGHKGLLWTRYSDDRSFAVPSMTGSVGATGTGGDVLAYHYSDGHIDLWNAVDGTTRTYRPPVGQSTAAVFGGTVATLEQVTAEDGTVTKVRHLLTPEADGTTTDVVVNGAPDGMLLASGPVRGDANAVFYRATLNGSARLVQVDPKTGQVVSWTSPLPSDATSVKLGPDRVVAFTGTNATTAYVYSRADLTADPVAVALDNPTGTAAATGLAIVGDWLVHRPGNGGLVTAVPIAGGDPVTLFSSSNTTLGVASDGTAVVIGRTGADDWGIQHITAGPDGKPVVTMLKALPKPPFPIQGLALDQGRLVEADASWANYRDTYGRTVATSGTPTFGPRSNHDGTSLLLFSCPATDVGCSQVFGAADGRAVWLSRGGTGSDQIRSYGPGQPNFWTKIVSPGGQITDVSGEYVLYTTATQQYVYKIDDEAGPKVTRTPGAAALSGDLLWTATGTAPGQVSAYNLSAKQTVETLTLDTAGCTPTELQADGRYLYWNCDGTTAGVYDRTTKKSVSVPADEAKLGDGYVVTHDKAAGKLVLTAVADGTPVSRVIGELPGTGVSQRDVRWTVDESGANAAYVDDKEQIHLVPSGVTQQPLRLLAPAANSAWVDPTPIDTTPGNLTTLLLSKPASGWRLTVRARTTGKVVDTADSTAESRGELSVGWFGMDRTAPGDVPLPNGAYDWTLSVTPADGTGAPLQMTGSVRIDSGSPVRRDHVGSDGIGDLLTLGSSGTLTFQQGTGKGTFSGTAVGRGWPATTLAVPFGDLNKDLCNDVLVRTTSGALRGYKPGCGAPLTPSTPYTSLGTSGWNQYDVLTSPGDLNKDGRADLITRNAATGAVYLYKSTSTGRFAARVKLYDNWKTYKKVVGAGDLNGDGVADLVAQDRANNLYRYYGTGRGGFGSRVKIASPWGVSYNAVVGVGDITGDGNSDLVARDTTGALYRMSGTGKGTFAARVRIGTGWQGYKGLF